MVNGEKAKGDHVFLSKGQDRQPSFGHFVRRKNQSGKNFQHPTQNENVFFYHLYTNWLFMLPWIAACIFLFLYSIFLYL